MGAGSFQSFVLMWSPMTAAMMLPSALPFIVSVARRSRAWAPASVAVVAAYLLVWTGFGVGAYLVSGAVSLPIPASIAAGVALAFAGLYSMTPLMRAGQARCIAMCHERGQLGVRAAAAKGISYGLSCVACSAGVMAAIVVLGMSNLGWIVAGATVVVLYKLAGRWTARVDGALSLAIVLTGVAVVMGFTQLS